MSRAGGKRGKGLEWPLLNENMRAIVEWNNVLVYSILNGQWAKQSPRSQIVNLHPGLDT